MKPSQQIDLDTILGSLNGMQRAQAPPFLFTRIEAELFAGSRFGKSRIGFAAGALAALVAVNVWVVMALTTPVQTRSHEHTAQHVSHQDESLVTDYQLYSE